MSDEIDSSNMLFMVAAHGENIVVMRPPVAPITRDQALNLAAWLVALADPLGEQFAKVLKAVQST
jgi:hypothetical protein